MAQCNENRHMHFLHEQEDSPQKKNDLEDQNDSEREHGSFFQIKKKKKKVGNVLRFFITTSSYFHKNSIYFFAGMAMDKLSGKIRHAEAFSLLCTSGIYFQ